MKSYLKITAVCLSLLSASPIFSQVRLGVDLRFGTPPPRREIIIARPYPDAIWVPGYYNNYGYRYLWVPGYWRRPQHFYDRWGRRDLDRHRDGERREFERGERDGRERYDRREGRIR